MHEFCRQAADLSDAQRSVLARRLRALGPRPLGRSPGVNSFDLALSQERLWFLDRLAPGHPVHNVSAAVRLRGELDEVALGGAIEHLVKRHEILRTVFDAEGGRPVQRVLPELRPGIERSDLRGEARGDRQPTAERILVRAARGGFDIGSGPLLRAVVVRTDERESLLCLVLHHLVCDANSVPIIVAELLRDYRSLAAGAAPPMAAPRIQFADYAVWQRYALAGEAIERLRAYWAAALEGAPRETSLRFDRPPPAKPSFRGARATRAITPTVAREIARLARSERATRFVVSTAAFAELLRARGAGEDLTLLATVANRDRPEASALVGFLANLVPLRVRLSGGRELREIVARARPVVGAALEHAALPFPAILAAVRFARGLERPPLSGVGVVVERDIEPARILPGLELEPVALDAGIARADLTLSVAWLEESIRLGMEYATDLFDRSTAESMLAQLEEILASGVATSAGRSRGASSRRSKERGHASDHGRDSGPGEGAAGSPEAVRPRPDALAYVIYTSGSTGTPKGVAVEHRGLLNHVLAKVSSLGLDDRACVAQTAPQTFDISLWQILAPLASGGRVRILSDADTRSPERLYCDVVTSRVTVLQLVPTMVRALARFLLGPEGGSPADGVDDDRPRDSLRWLIATGDVLAPSVGRDWLRVRPNVPLLNAYGPTECSDDVTQHVVEAEADVAGERVPIGRPIANARVFVLNEALFPVPRGTPGEICVAGIPLGRGYLGDGGATAAAFVPHALVGHEDGRLYRTGDRGRFRADGALEFLGRCDAQVKVRGCRIEPAEVEAAILRHPAILSAAVSAVGGDAERTLVAYVAVRPEERIDAAALRDFLRGELPAPLVPSRWISLERLPTTPNGKIDRGALPPIETARSLPATATVEPRTDLESELVRIWRDLLRRDDLGIDDDFFLAGGDSIACVEMVARARRSGIGISIEDVFEAPRIASLASRARRFSPPAIDQAPIEGEIGLTPIQRAFFAQAGDSPHHFNQAVCLAVRPELTVPELAVALGTLLDHHDALRSYFRLGAGGWTAHCAAPGLRVHVARFDLSALSPDAQRRRLEAEVEAIQRSFDVGVPPLVGAAFFDLGAARAPRVALVFHHLVIDATSLRILLGDLDALLAPRAPGDRSRLAPKTASIRDVATYLRAIALEPDLDEEIDFWAAQAHGAPLALPRDLDDGANDASSAREVVVDLDVEETLALLRPARPRAHASAVELLLAAVAFALARWTRDGAPAIFIETSGREHLPPDLDVSRTVGWLTAVFPVRVPVSPTSSVSACLAAARVAWDAVRARGARYGALVFAADAALRGRMAALPTPEVSLNYLGALMDSPERLAGLEVVAEPLGAELSGGLRRPTLLDVEACIRCERLRIRFLYSANRHRRATIEAFARAVVGALRAVAQGPARLASPGGSPRSEPREDLDAPSD